MINSPSILDRQCPVKTDCKFIPICRTSRRSNQACIFLESCSQMLLQNPPNLLRNSDSTISHQFVCFFIAVSRLHVFWTGCSPLGKGSWCAQDTRPGKVPRVMECTRAQRRQLELPDPKAQDPKLSFSFFLERQGSTKFRELRQALDPSTKACYVDLFLTNGERRSRSVKRSSRVVLFSLRD